MKRLTLALRQRRRASIPLQSLLILAACVLWTAAKAGEGITPDKWFYEIDGDYESEIVDIDHDGIPEVKDGGVETMGVRQNCDNWKHTDDAPYMGPRAYTVRCIGNPFLNRPEFPEYVSNLTVRSEQHVLQDWRASADSQRSLSFAFRLSEVDAVPRVHTITGRADSGWIAQLHGEGLPFILAWQAHTEADPDRGIPVPGYYLYAGAKYDVEDTEKPGSYYTMQPYGLLGRLTPGTWNRVMIQLDAGKGSAKCPGAIGDDAFWTIARMDNATGLWSEPLRYPFPPGHQAYEPGQRLGNEIYVADGDKPYQVKGECLHPDDQNYNFKIGQYVVIATNRLDYDNISYGKRWINITKNHLIGYKKSVLLLPFEDMGVQAIARRVEDHSYIRNGGTAGDPTQDYDNDGLIMGREVTRIDDGVKGRALHFPGKRDNFVKVPIGPNTVDDFDVGNYMTVSAWFRTGETPSDNKGLVMIDEFSDTWKLLLYMRGNGMAFGVRHRVDPGRPGVYSRLDHVFPMGQYANGHWHLVTGTYNRFAHDGKRIKLYIDGEKVMEGEGHDLPILRGENQLVVGKYSVDGFFEGDIDDVGLFNYTMTGAHVRNLWRESMERVVP